ncbi:MULTISPECIES: hypothetical protein [unclassified Alcanivorax]|jgi:hypothetical protein|uniref:hypothetical protein n=1 Tax=unclassified Alcanivorax TaxID=2638842 RepID=UPI000789E9DB|nr:hypothetical protein [Alcanivorax sp. NBRC 102024]
MNKDEWIWVAIRIFGIYLLVLAIISIPEAIGAIYAHLNVADAASQSAEIASFADSLRKAALSKGITAISQLMLFSMASYYLICRGKLIHRLASRETGQ